MAKRFFIIDGLGQIFRSYYAPFSAALTSPTGEPTKATYVFCTTLLQLVREHKPDYLALAMDSDEGKVFRAAIDAEYKANREPPPEDLAPQIKRILKIVSSQDIPIIAKPGFEADDVMATLCELLQAEDLDVILVSTDKDLEQMLTPRTRMFDPKKNAFTGPDELRDKKGYGPAQAVEIQSLTGDSTDNIPGIKGVGPKKAAGLIAKYGSADAVIQHADELTPAMKKNVLAFADQLPITRQLVTLRRDVELDFDLDACEWKGLKPARLLPIFRELGFRRLVDQLDTDPGEMPTDGSATPAAPPGGLFASPPTSFTATPPRHYVLVDDDAKLDAFLAELGKQSCFAFDTETTHLNASWAKLVGLSFSWAANTGYYLPVAGLGQALPLKTTLERLRPIMADPNVAKVGQNIKYDLVVLAHHGVPVDGVAFDTMIASFVLDSARRSHGMDALAHELLGFTPIPITDLIGKGRNQITFADVEIARAAEYAAEDADVTWQLYEIFRDQLAHSDLKPLFDETEMPLVEVLTAMEAEGVNLDTEFLAGMSKELAQRLDALTARIHDEAGRPFNIDSPKQLAALLFDELGLPKLKKTKTGYSTDAETLESLAAQTDHPVPTLVKEYRELTKLKGTYIDTLPTMICPRTGRVHASFNQTVAVTGRLSSSDPNLQNIPIRTELGRKIRRAFLPPDEDHRLITADYSQIELRVLAHFCKDRALVEAFTEDQDIHAFVAAQVFGKPIEEVTRDERSRAKAVNFGIVYGQTAYGLARTTGMPVGEAQTFIDMYFMRYPGIRMFIDKVVAEAKKQGGVQTILGRRRAVPEINSRNRNLYSAGERLAVNTVIQGSAADLIKRAMINIFRQIRSENRPLRMLIQVHDELVFSVPAQAVEAESAFIREAMCNAMTLDVPLKVDLASGANWLESK